MHTGFLVILLIIAIALIILIYLQSGWARNVSSSIIGTHNVDLFENTKTRGTERFLIVVTALCVALFLIFSILIQIL